MLSRFTGALIPPYLRPTPIVRWIGRLGRPPVRIFWRLVELLLYFQCRLGTKIAQRQNLVPSKPVIGDEPEDRDGKAPSTSCSPDVGWHLFG